MFFLFCEGSQTWIFLFDVQILKIFMAWEQSLFRSIIRFCKSILWSSQQPTKLSFDKHFFVMILTEFFGLFNWYCSAKEKQEAHCQDDVFLKLLRLGGGSWIMNNGVKKKINIRAWFSEWWLRLTQDYAKFQARSSCLSTCHSSLQIPLCFYSKIQGRIQGEGAGGAHPPPPWDDLRFSNTTGILQKKKTMWFIRVLKWSNRRVHPLLKKIPEI